MDVGDRCQPRKRLAMRMAQDTTPAREGRKVKCLVWDLDNTLWNGVLLEDGNVTLRDGAEALIRELDRRGILQSVASRNDHDLAMAKLREFGLDEIFIYPQIGWNAKSASVKAIAETICIGTDTLAFIDDQPFERDEVSHVLPEVLCIDAADLDRVIDMPAMMPRFVTAESQDRRRMYKADIERKQAEEAFQGAQDEFLATLQMSLTIAPARYEDLRRAEELTLRTNQLNTTGYTYSFEDLDRFRTSDRHHLWVAGLEDRYGAYGKIGLALVEADADVWMIRLLLMSCRVMNRGVGSVFINHIRNRAREARVRLMAEMVPNDRNRMMYMTYKFNHFREVEKRDDLIVFENDLSKVQAFPGYLDLTVG
jgi:FkbH-like protein